MEALRYFLRFHFIILILISGCSKGKKNSELPGKTVNSTTEGKYNLSGIQQIPYTRVLERSVKLTQPGPEVILNQRSKDDKVDTVGYIHAFNFDYLSIETSSADMFSREFPRFTEYYWPASMDNPSDKSAEELKLQPLHGKTLKFTRTNNQLELVDPEQYDPQLEFFIQSESKNVRIVHSDEFLKLFPDGISINDSWNISGQEIELLLFIIAGVSSGSGTMTLVDVDSTNDDVIAELDVDFELEVKFSSGNDPIVMTSALSGTVKRSLIHFINYETDLNGTFSYYKYPAGSSDDYVSFSFDGTSVVGSEKIVE